MDNFKGIKYFKPTGTSDQWGDPSMIDRRLLLALDALREAVGMPIYITSGYRSGDSGQHGKGLAVDVVCPGMGLLDFYLTAERFPFTGIGVYPFFSYQGRKVGGLHLDVRDVPARWMGLGTGKNQSYVALSEANLRATGVI